MKEDLKEGTSFDVFHDAKLSSATGHFSVHSEKASALLSKCTHTKHHEMFITLLTKGRFPSNISTSHISMMHIIQVDICSERFGYVLAKESLTKHATDNPEALLPLPSAAFHILLALIGGERHGYGIMQETALQSDGKIILGPGTLYRSIRRLLDDGLIQESDERPAPDLDDERRHYYRLTPFGLRVARAEAERLATLVRMAQSRHLLPQPGTAMLEGERE